MGYIATAEVAAMRKSLKSALPQFKLSVLRLHRSTVSITLLEGPVDFGSGYSMANHLYIDEHYKGRPQAKEVLKKVLKIVDEHKKVTTTGDGYSDYGTSPNYYISLQIGIWNKPYKLKENGDGSALHTDRQDMPRL